MSKSFLKSVKIIFLLSVYLAAVASPLVFAANNSEVWVVLGVHGSPQTAPQLSQEFADEFSKTIDAAILKSNQPLNQTLALWFENATPPSLFYSLSEPSKFFGEIETQTGIPSLEFQEMLLEPEFFNSKDAQGVIEVLKEIFKAHEARFHETRNANAGPRVFSRWILRLKETRSVEVLSEETSFRAWFWSLKSAAWDSRMFEEILQGDMEAALRSKMRKGVTENRSDIFRDKKLAADILLYHKEHPGTLSIVIRGAVHGRLADYVKKSGIESKIFYQTDPQLIGSSSGFWAKYASRPDLFKRKLQLSQEDRDAMTQELIYEMNWKYLLENDPEIFLDNSRMKTMKNAVEALDSEKLKTWRSLMGSKAGDLKQQADASWNWLVDLDPSLRRE